MVDNEILFVVIHRQRSVIANSRASVVSAHVVSLAFTSSWSLGTKWAEAVTVDGFTR